MHRERHAAAAGGAGEDEDGVAGRGLGGERRIERDRAADAGRGRARRGVAGAVADAARSVARRCSDAPPRAAPPRSARLGDAGLRPAAPSSLSGGSAVDDLLPVARSRRVVAAVVGDGAGQGERLRMRRVDREGALDQGASIPGCWRCRLVAATASA